MGRRYGCRVGCDKKFDTAYVRELHEILKEHPAMKTKTMMFTATTPERQRDDFLFPCWERRREIQAFYGVEKVVDDSDYPLGQKYEFARELAMSKNMEWLLLIEDDELPDITILKRFREVAEEKQAKLITSPKPLRAYSSGTQIALYTPTIWFMEAIAINARIMKIDQVKPHEGPPVFIRAGNICPPMLIHIPTIVDRNLHFKGGRHCEIPESWDYIFSMDLMRTGIGFWCVPDVKTKHYCPDQHKIFE